MGDFLRDVWYDEVARKIKGLKYMNGFLLLIPFLLIRFLLLSVLNKVAVGRAAYFAPVQGKERAAYYIYQISNIGMFLYLIFLKVKADFSRWFYLGLACYILGLCLCAVAVICFSFPDDMGMNRNGIYKFSRNPMYVAYFICFAGMALLTQSLILLLVVVVFQISAHWIILAEERWCMARFGTAYGQYMKEVRRYF